MPTLIVIENPSNTFTELTPGQNIVDTSGVQHPWQITDVWTDADLEALNIYRVASASVPANSQVTSYTFSRVNGVVTQVLTLTAVPRSVSPRQIRLAMNTLGIRTICDNWVQAQSQDVQDSWDYATEIIENNPLILACMEGVGKTQADLTSLFDLASSIGDTIPTAPPQTPPVATVG
jgi:hypothetical protein